MGEGRGRNSKGETGWPLLIYWHFPTQRSSCRNVRFTWERGSNRFDDMYLWRNKVSLDLINLRLSHTPHPFAPSFPGNGCGARCRRVQHIITINSTYLSSIFGKYFLLISVPPISLARIMIITRVWFLPNIFPRQINNPQLPDIHISNKITPWNPSNLYRSHGSRPCA